MLTKDKKPEEKGGGKEDQEVIPPKADVPEMFKAALKVTKQAGIEGTFAKLRDTYTTAEGSEVRGSTAERRIKLNENKNRTTTREKKVVFVLAGSRSSSLANTPALSDPSGAGSGRRRHGGRERRQLGGHQDDGTT